MWEVRFNREQICSRQLKETVFAFLCSCVMGGEADNLSGSWYLDGKGFGDFPDNSRGHIGNACKMAGLPLARSGIRGGSDRRES